MIIGYDEIIFIINYNIWVLFVIILNYYNIWKSYFYYVLKVRIVLIYMYDSWVGVFVYKYVIFCDNILLRLYFDLEV